MASARLRAIHSLGLLPKSGNVLNPIRLWTGLFDATLQGIAASSPGLPVPRTVLRMPQTGMEVHLLDPTAADEKADPPLKPFNHVAVSVDDVSAARSQLLADGVTILPSSPGASAAEEFFIDPDASGEGCLLQVRGAEPTALSSEADPAPAVREAVLEASARFADKPFRVLGLQQLAVGGLDKSRLSRLWVDLFGLAYKSTYVSEKENVDEDILVLGEPGPREVEVDIMQPIDPETAPKVHLPPLNHLGLWVDDIHGAVEYMQANGVRFAPGGIRPGAAGFDVTFLHPKGSDEAPLSGDGVLIELVQAPHEVVKELS
eukprot:g3350.t1